METLNFVNVSKAKIQVKENLCVFIPATLEINDEKRGNIFLNFGDISSVNPPSKVRGDLFVYDFSNPVDAVRLNPVLKDERVECDSLNDQIEFLLQARMRAQYSRNSFIRS